MGIKKIQNILLNALPAKQKIVKVAGIECYVWLSVYSLERINILGWM